MLFVIPVLLADETAQRQQTQEQLQELREKIHSLQQEIEPLLGKRNVLQQDLKEVERRIAKHSRKIRKLDRNISVQGKKLSELEKTRRELQKDLELHRIKIGNQVRAAYFMGRQAYLKLLLNQQDPAQVGRMLVYYDYMNRARSQRMVEIDKKVTELEAISREIRVARNELRKTRKNIVNERQSLKQVYSERNKLIASLNEDINLREQRLQQFRNDEEHLENLLAGIRQVVKEAALPPVKTQPFGSLKGQLPWPASGNIIHRFGSSRKVGELKWQGIVIQAREGSQVAAVANGRVVFADWLRGFGLLIIVDHDNGYMSLYGYNQHLLKQAGDWVEAGEVLASVGNSGGQPQTGLYFEIRKAGRPENPLKWFIAARK